MENMLNNSNSLLQQVEVFNTLYRGFPNSRQLDQFTQLSLLHAANQLVVPEATPVPGYERLGLPRMTTQDIASAFEFPDGRSYMDELLMGETPETVEELFNGRATLSLDQNDIDQYPDLSVFEDDQLLSEPFTANLTELRIKEEARSPVSCDSQSVFSYSSASPPHSPAMSEVSSQAYSTDEGIQSDFSDVEEFLETISNVGSPLSIPEEPEKSVAVKKELTDVTPTKTPRKKRGPKPPVKYRGDGPIQLWQFLLELIIDPACKHLIKWTQDEDLEFKILQPATVAKMWGKKKNKPTMNYEKLSRGLRYYYGKSVIEKVHGKRYVYQFMCNIPKILGYNPMVKCEEESAVEDSVCGEPVMSPEVEELLVSSLVEDEFLAASIDLSALCEY